MIAGIVCPKTFASDRQQPSRTSKIALISVVCRAVTLEAGGGGGGVIMRGLYVLGERVKGYAKIVCCLPVVDQPAFRKRVHQGQGYSYSDKRLKGL